MKKDSKLKNIHWIKMPTNLMEDYRIEALVEHEGVKGLGLYLTIVCCIYSRQSRYITLDQLNASNEKGIGRKPTKRVCHNYGLFNIDEYGHVRSAINYLDFNDDLCNQFDVSCASPTPARVPIIDYKTETETKKNDYHHSKKDDDDDDDDNVDAIKPIVEFVDDDPIPHVASDPVSIIRQLPLQSQWTEMALMRCAPTLRQLIIANWEQAKELFAQHVIANCKEKSILTEEDAKRYFLYYLANPRTSADLQKHLVETLRQQQLERLTLQEEQDYELSE